MSSSGDFGLALSAPHTFIDLDALTTPLNITRCVPFPSFDEFYTQYCTAEQWEPDGIVHFRRERARHVPLKTETASGKGVSSYLCAPFGGLRTNLNIHTVLQYIPSSFFFRLSNHDIMPPHRPHFRSRRRGAVCGGERKQLYSLFSRGQFCSRERECLYNRAITPRVTGL